MNISQINQPSALQSVTPASQPAPAAKPAKTVIEAAQADSLNVGERFLHGSVQGTKAAAIPAMVAGTASLVMMDPDYAQFGLLIGPAVGLMGAGLAGAVVGGTANALGAGKATAVTGGAMAGAATGWALSNTSTPKWRMMSAGAGAVIGGAAGYAGSGAKIEGHKMLNSAAGGVAGLMLSASVAAVLSRGKDISGLAHLAIMATGAASFYATHQLQK